MARTTILLADDNKAILEEVCRGLETEFQIVGCVHNGKDAVDSVIRFEPDVLILDISMPLLNGLQVASHLRERHLRTKILFFSVHEQPEYVSAAISAGGTGYVPKQGLSELAFAIRELAKGKTFISSFGKT